jgi:predicted phage terminase large subunit-like protein
VGVGAGVAGHGGDLVVIDDPVKNREEANSKTYRDRVEDWYTDDIYTRLEPDAALILIMTRWHGDDLAGRILAGDDADSWIKVILPAEAMEGDPLGRQVGEALCRDRYDEEALAAIRRVLLSSYWPLYQQSPQPETGEVFLQEWWEGQNRYDATDRRIYNRNVGRWLSFDTGFKDQDENDPAAMGVVELTPEYELVVREAWTEKLLFPSLVARMKAEAERWNTDGKLRGIVIEDKGAGTSAYQTLQESAEGWMVEKLVAFNPMGSKVERAKQASVWCERGCVKLPYASEAASWLLDFEEQLFNFPAVPHDDMVDEFTQITLYLEHLLAEGWRVRNRDVERELLRVM